MSWFQQGYEKVEQRAQEISEAMNRTFLPNFMIKDTDENVYASFVTSDPITYYEHFLPSMKKSFTCPDSGDSSKGTCPLCAMGNKPSFRGAYLVVDHRYEEFKTKSGEDVKQQHTLKIAKFGIRVLKQLQKLDAKLKKGSPIQAPIPQGILGLPFEVVRSGTGTDTSYTFNPLQPSEEHFPRKYEIAPKDGKPQTEQEIIIEAIKPLSREDLLAKVNGGTAPTQPSYGQPAQFGGQPPQQFGGQPPQQGGGTYAPFQLPADEDDDVIDFGGK